MTIKPSQIGKFIFKFKSMVHKDEFLQLYSVMLPVFPTTEEFNNFHKYYDVEKGFFNELNYKSKPVIDYLVSSDLIDTDGSLKDYFKIFNTYEEFSLYGLAKNPNLPNFSNASCYSCYYGWFNKTVTSDIIREPFVKTMEYVFCNEIPVLDIKGALAECKLNDGSIQLSDNYIWRIIDNQLKCFIYESLY